MAKREIAAESTLVTPAGSVAAENAFLAYLGPTSGLMSSCGKMKAKYSLMAKPLNEIKNLRFKSS